MYPKSAYERIFETLNKRLYDERLENVYEAYYDGHGHPDSSVLIKEKISGTISEYGFGPDDEDDIKNSPIESLIVYAFCK